VMVVDARAELAAPDLELARLLRKTGKPLFVAANKVDSDKQSSLADDLHRLGIREIVSISAEHGRGVDDLLDAVLAALPKKNPTTEDTESTEGKATERKSKERNSTAGAPSFPRSVREGGDVDSQLPSTDNTEDYRKSKPQSQRSRRRQESTAPPPPDDREPTADDERPTTNDERPPSEVRVAIIGHPNVGKSTLLNQLTGADRAIVSPVPGTTRDAVDEVVERDGMKFRFIDTAGIRRKGKTHLMAEKLSVVMARKHLEAADIALLVIDATEGVSALDAAIAGYAHESGRSIVVVVNKWDMITSGQKKAVSQSRTARIQDGKRPDDCAAYEQRLRYALKFLNYAPVLFVSAAKGKGTDKIFPTLEKVAAERRKRVTTGEMNRFLKHVDFDRASVPVRQRVKILYLTQAAVAPPTFILFTDRQVKLHFSYQRFLENQIRAAFGFAGTPIWIKVRAR
jgi:GTP-binding protein